MNYIKKNWYKIILFPQVVFSPLFIVHAVETEVPPVSSGINNPIPNITSIPGLIQLILKSIISIGLPIIALAIVYSGFLFVFARGNPEKLTKAKSAFFTTLIGGAVLMGAWAIAEMISSTITGL